MQEFLYPESRIVSSSLLFSPTPIFTASLRVLVVLDEGGDIKLLEA